MLKGERQQAWLKKRAFWERMKKKKKRFERAATSTLWGRHQLLMDHPVYTTYIRIQSTVSSLTGLLSTASCYCAVIQSGPGLASNSESPASCSGAPTIAPLLFTATKVIIAIMYRSVDTYTSTRDQRHIDGWLAICNSKRGITERALALQRKRAIYTTCIRVQSTVSSLTGTPQHDYLLLRCYSSGPKINLVLHINFS